MTGKHNAPLLMRKHSVLPQTEMEKNKFTVKMGNLYLLKATFIMVSTGSASSKSQKNWVRYTQAKYNFFFFFKFQINSFEAIIFTFTVWSF